MQACKVGGRCTWARAGRWAVMRARGVRAYVGFAVRLTARFGARLAGHALTVAKSFRYGFFLLVACFQTPYFS